MSPAADHRAAGAGRTVPVSLGPPPIAEELRRTGAEVRFDRGSRALYATDASNYRQVPIGVVVPRTLDDVEATVAACRRHDLPVLTRGGGTSLAGQCCNRAVVIDASKYLRAINWIDPDRSLASVQPGCVLDDLRDAAQAHGLTFGPDPSTHNRCTLGGMAGNNSCGMHAQMAGRMAENVEELEILTYDGLRLRVGPTSEDELERIIAEGGRRGEIYGQLRDLRDRYADQIRDRFPDIPRRVSGYCLEQLLPENGFNVARALVGSEGTCVTILEVVGRLVPARPHRTLVVLGYPDVFRAADHIPDILRHEPIALEAIDAMLMEHVQRLGLAPEDTPDLPEGRGWLIVQFGADSPEEADRQAKDLADALRDVDDPPSVKVFEDPDEEGHLWAIRESALGATAHVPGEPDRWPGWEDSAVAPSELGSYLRDLKALFDRYGYRASLYGHFGQGCVHCRIDFDLLTADGVAHWRSFLEEAADLVVRHGGSLSGEHGDGQQRAWLLPRMYGDDLVQAFREFKAIWDPTGRMNPGKVVDPLPVDADLRLGADYQPDAVETTFAYPSDGGSFAGATLRCVGVGLCRREDGGTMCPSYMVTHEEMHSTRGRARLLYEMLSGELRYEGWRSEPVREALDLCLSCKGCKGDCPVNVDVATYKAEFLSHHYRGRLRPLTAYTIGLIPFSARLASPVAGLANAVTGAPVLGRALKRLAGVAPERPVPTFATQTFRQWFRARTPANPAGPEVVVFPDTFTDRLDPTPGRATVEVLEALGYRVVVPDRWMCCGRPLYDYGMLDTARRLLDRCIDELRPHLRTGTPIVGIEPSCLTVFRDEAQELYPEDPDVRRLGEQARTLSELLVDRVDPDRLPRVSRPALVHGHCHHTSVLGFGTEAELIDRVGIEATTTDGGCCGMAGSFGFERDHYDVSVAVGEHGLLPQVRGTPPEHLVIADGFSCRTQITDLTGRRAVHLAEVLADAFRSAR